MQRRLLTLNAEPDGDEVRLETLRGDEFLVAPVVLVREGVLNGGYLGYDEIQASVPGWNGRPLTAPPDEGTQAANLAPEQGVSGHPVTTNGDGEPEFVSANRMPFIEDMHVGFLANVEADDSIRGLVGEAWLNAARAEQVGEQALQAARNIAEGEPLDVSTGYFHRPIRTQGTHEGTRYEVEQKDLMPDHLALLPNEQGACSWGDGCGVPRVNALLNANTGPDSLSDRVLGILGIDGDEAEFETEGGGCGCGCGGSCNHETNEDAETAANTSDEPDGQTNTETMQDYDIETLAERSAFDAETLNEWDEDDLAALAETVEAANEDGDEDTNDDDTTETANAGDGDGGDGENDEVAALREQVAALSERVEKDDREQLVNTVTANTGYDREAVESLDTDALETLAENAPDDGAAQGNAATRGHGANYVGQAGGQGEPGEDETEAYTAQVGALATLSAEESE